VGLEEPGIAVDDVASSDVIFADVVVLDPVPKLNDSAGVGVASEVGVTSEVGEVGESELWPAAVLEGVLISLLVAQHAGVPFG
jgi:hypothetical protein